MAGVMAVSGLCVGASANPIGENRLVSFEWGLTYAKTTNMSDTSRIIEASIYVSHFNTEDHFDIITDTKKGGKDTPAKAVNNKYSINSYFYQYSGCIYNGNDYNSHIAWSSGLHEI